MASLLTFRTRRAQRALERQLAYQTMKARQLPNDRSTIELELTNYARQVRARVETYRPMGAGVRVLEVGSGPHGLVFFMGIPDAIGVDPLAVEYATLFPHWQARAKTVAACGEALPFPSASFDFVFSDNVIDHAEDPATIVRELARVLVPGGILYFTVHVHHPIYGAASRVYGVWQALQSRVELAPFADHTVHLAVDEARLLFKGIGLQVLNETVGISAARAEAKHEKPRHVGDRLKRHFFKNARFELIARRAE